MSKILLLIKILLTLLYQNQSINHLITTKWHKLKENGHLDR